MIFAAFDPTKSVWLCVEEERIKIPHKNDLFRFYFADQDLEMPFLSVIDDKYSDFNLKLFNQLR